MEQYKIVSITHLDGTPREDKHYPNLVGKDIRMYPDCFNVGRHLFGQIKGEPSIKTSKVKEVSMYGKTIVARTKNSIYTLERMED